MLEAKPNLKCVFGHSCCRINHTKFNIVKPVSDIVQWDSSCTRSFTNSFEGSLGKERIAKLDTDAVHQDGKMLKLKKNDVLQDKALIKKLLRQVDKSQLKWSVPPTPVLVNLSDIVPEIFASLWDNVYYLFRKDALGNGYTDISSNLPFRGPTRCRTPRPIPILYYPRRAPVKQIWSQKNDASKNLAHDNAVNPTESRISSSSDSDDQHDTEDSCSSYDEDCTCYNQNLSPVEDTVVEDEKMNASLGSNLELTDQVVGKEWAEVLDKTQCHATVSGEDSCSEHSTFSDVHADTFHFSELNDVRVEDEPTETVYSNNTKSETQI